MRYWCFLIIRKNRIEEIIWSFPFFRKKNMTTIMTVNFIDELAILHVKKKNLKSIDVGNNEDGIILKKQNRKNMARISGKNSFFHKISENLFWLRTLC